tara:strand:+ start:7572 stop:8972 length:1401 start_codon:yes stop_codon:yes gene_type:complete
MSTLRKYRGTRVHTFDPSIGEYQGTNGLIYYIGSRKTVNIPQDIQFSAGASPVMESEFLSRHTPGRLRGLGVILDSTGKELFAFYPDTLINAASGNNQKVFTELRNPTFNNSSTLPAGDYEIVTFIPQIDDNIDRSPGDFSGGGGYFIVEGSALLSIHGNIVASPATPIPVTQTGTPPPTNPPPTDTPPPPVTQTGTPVVEAPTPTPQVPTGIPYTLSYSEGVKGWPSFYSYNPDFMIGMNNYFYTFAGANLYRHNANEQRNNFYGVQYPAKITTVFNREPLRNKVFKTLSLESNGAWTSSMSTDIGQNAAIQNAWFELKEGNYYAAIKNVASSPATLNTFRFRSINGIGNTTGFNVTNPRIFNFSVPIDSIIAIGDFLYYINVFDNQPKLAGIITAIGTSSITVDSTISGATNPTSNTPLMLAAKNTLAESHGLLGHYMITTIENGSSSNTELFALTADVFKSYP